jgi:uncharacterized damage-inducible protein DinB
MKQIRWFERKFEFKENQNIFPSIIERLKGTPIRLVHKVSKIKEQHLTVKLEDTWSISENVGHLIDLEPLWLGRLEDIFNNKKEMRPADLENKKTEIANHNSRKIEALILEFTKNRETIVNQLETLSDDDVFKYALHPRLMTPMRIMDLFLFVADHDDHHLARISEINRLINQG